jgi:aldose 1-epimerase
MQENKGRFCFTDLSGEDIYLFTLSNANTQITITNYGAIITSFKILQADGSTNDIVLGFDDVRDYLSVEYRAACPYFGAAIGRYGNRIKNGQFFIDGSGYSLPKNKGADHLHGGHAGFDKKVWTCDYYSSQELVLSYRSKDGEEGYPGTLETTIRFALGDNNEMLYEFRATTDKATAVNLTHHSYFNLNNGKGFITDHLVTINSSSILEQDDNLVATGKILTVENSVYDFRGKKAVSKEWPPAGYDQTYELDKNGTVDAASGLVLAAEALSEVSRIKLAVYTSEPVVHFYTGNWIPVVKGKNEVVYGPASGFCFETQKHPNSINIPHFPTTVLQPGTLYHTMTMYKITAG